MRYAQLVMGPAGSGKSTYCCALVEHGLTTKRRIRVVNLDPAAENFNYPCELDIRDLIQIDDVMDDETLRLGPNGGLVYCMEFLAENLNWLEENLGDAEDDYFLFDCPGQIELYTHIPVMKRIVSALQSWNFHVAGVFLLDTQFMLEMSKFLSGSLVALSAMIGLEIPHVNVLTKMDLLNKENRELVESYLEPDSHVLLEEDSRWNPKYRKLTRLLSKTLEDYSLVKFVPLNIKDEESVAEVLMIIDNTVQYGEDLDVRDRYPQETADDDED